MLPWPCSRHRFLAQMMRTSDAVHAVAQMSTLAEVEPTLNTIVGSLNELLVALPLCSIPMMN